MNVVAVIPARGGSKRLHRKNLRLLDGVPLLVHGINDAKKTKLINRIIVSTEDPEIAEVAKQNGAEAPFLRPADIAQDLSSIEAVLNHTVEWLEKNEGYKTDIVVFISCDTFFRQPEWIDWCIQKLLDDPTIETAFVANPTHKNYWQKVDGVYKRLRDSDKIYTSGQVKAPVYREDTGLASATRVALIKQGLRTGDKVAILEKEYPFVDIHTEFDLWQAEEIAQYNKKHSK